MLYCKKTISVTKDKYKEGQREKGELKEAERVKEGDRTKPDKVLDKNHSSK